MTLIDIERPAVTDDDPRPRSPWPPPVAEAPPAPAPPPHAPETAPRPRRRLFADLGAPLSRTWGLALIGAWIVVVAVGMAVEPAPVNPDAPVPLAADLLNTGLLLAWGSMAAGVFQRRRLAAAASLVGGLGLLALTVACPTSGHHGFGAWWGVQLVGVAALLALSGRALRAPNGGSQPPLAEKCW